MPSSSTDKPLYVSTDGTAGPYIIVTPEQLAPVVEALRSGGISFQVDQDAVLLNGARALAVIDLGMEADVPRVQLILERVDTELQKSGRRRGVPTRQELIIRGDAESMQELLSRFAKGSQGGWERRSEVEERLLRTLPPGTIAYSFSKSIPTIGRQVAVLMQARGPGHPRELHLTGVVPLTGREGLDLGQHDQAVTDFRESFVNPLVEGLKVRIFDRGVSIQPTLDEVLSTEALTRFRRFVATANKNNPHELDLRRWSDFIGQTHLDETDIDLGLLDSSLASEGFGEKPRSQLIQDFESGRRLLNVLDEERQ